MKQTKEQRELNNYTRSKPTNDVWEQDYLQGEGSGAYTDELQAYRRMLEKDPEAAKWYQDFNDSWYAGVGWKASDQDDKDRRAARVKDVFTMSKRASLDSAIKELETRKDIQT